MKYKNIELNASEDSETEILCGVEFENLEEDDEIVEQMEERLYELFKDYPHEIMLEAVTDNFILVRCWDITFNEQGVTLVKNIYDELMKAELSATISIGVHSDSEWFKREDSSEYNQDDVSYEEFVANIVY